MTTIFAKAKRLTSAAAVLGFAAAAATAAAPNPPPGPPTPRPAFLDRQSAEVQEGYALYVDKGCYLCHGHVGQGSPMSGPPLLVGAPYAYLLRFVRVPRNQMPPFFPETLSDEQVKHIASYLQALPADRKPDEIPMLGAVKPR